MNAKKQVNRPGKPQEDQQGTSWSRRLTWGVVAVVGMGLIVLLAVSLVSEEFLTGVPDGTDQVEVGPPEHVEGELYDDHEVPAGGEHSEVWQNCGFYDTPIQAENALHSLEHGAVWVTYSPSISADQVAMFRKFTGPIDKVLVSPLPDQESPIVATAWANQLSLEDASDLRLEQFVNEFTSSPTGPEPGGRCNGGIGNPDF